MPNLTTRLSTGKRICTKQKNLPGNVQAWYDFFDSRRDRTELFDEGDAQNIHAWMLAVTKWIDEQETK